MATSVSAGAGSSPSLPLPLETALFLVHSPFVKAQLTAIEQIAADWQDLLTAKPRTRITLSAASAGEDLAPPKALVPKAKLFLRCIRILADFKRITVFKKTVADNPFKEIYELGSHEPREEDLKRLFTLQVENEGYFAATRSAEMGSVILPADALALQNYVLKKSSHIKKVLIEKRGVLAQEDMDDIFQEIEKDIKLALASPRALSRLKQILVELSELKIFIKQQRDVFVADKEKRAQFKEKAALWLDSIDELLKALDFHIMLQGVLRQCTVLQVTCTSSAVKADKSLSQLCRLAQQFQEICAAIDPLVEEVKKELKKAFEAGDSKDPVFLKVTCQKFEEQQSQVRKKLSALFEEAILEEAERIFSVCGRYLNPANTEVISSFSEEEIKATRDFLNAAEQNAMSLKIKGEEFSAVCKLAVLIATLCMKEIPSLQGRMQQAFGSAIIANETELLALSKALHALDQLVDTSPLVTEGVWRERFFTFKEFINAHQARIEEYRLRTRFAAFQSCSLPSLERPIGIKSAWTLVDQLRSQINRVRLSKYHSPALIALQEAEERHYFAWLSALQEAEGAYLARAPFTAPILKAFLRAINGYNEHHSTLSQNSSVLVSPDYLAAHLNYQERNRLYTDGLVHQYLQRVRTLAMDDRLKLNAAVVSGSDLSILTQTISYAKDAAIELKQTKGCFTSNPLYTEVRDLVCALADLTTFAGGIISARSLLNSAGPIKFEEVLSLERAMANFRRDVKNTSYYRPYEADFEIAFKSSATIFDQIIHKYIDREIALKSLEGSIDMSLPPFKKLIQFLKHLQSRGAALINIKDVRSRLAEADEHITLFKTCYTYFSVFNIPYFKDFPQREFLSIYHAADVATWKIIKACIKEILTDFCREIRSRLDREYRTFSKEKITECVNEFFAPIVRVFEKHGNNSRDYFTLMNYKDELIITSQTYLEGLQKAVHAHREGVDTPSTAAGSEVSPLGDPEARDDKERALSGPVIVAGAAGAVEGSE